MAHSANFNTLWNIVFPNKNVLFTHALEINTKNAHLKYSTPVIQSEIFPVPPSTDEGDTWDMLKE